MKQPRINLYILNTPNDVSYYRVDKGIAALLREASVAIEQLQDGKGRVIISITSMTERNFERVFN